MAQTFYEIVFLNEEGVIPRKFENQENNNNTWNLDNDASNHIASNLSLFTKLNGKLKVE